MLPYFPLKLHLKERTKIKKILHHVKSEPKLKIVYLSNLNLSTCSLTNIP